MAEREAGGRATERDEDDGVASGGLRLFLLRHGIAEDPSDARSDAERRLTERGEKRLRREVASLRRAGFEFDRVLHSPWARAARTAELLVPLLVDEDPGRLQGCPELARAPSAGLFARLAGEPSGSRLALVGHEPWLTQLALQLAGLQGGGMAPGLDLRKGGLIELEGAPRAGGMRLLALLPPRLARRLPR